MGEPRMIYLVTTAQRCGSTWLVRMLGAMAEARDVYVDGLAMGFRLAIAREADAVEKMARHLRAAGGRAVFKTHDVPSRDFDTLCAALPELRVLTMHRDFRDTVVSRYFYLRYYWQTDPGLGALPAEFAEFLSKIGEMPDREALAALLETEIVPMWAREWAAFETPFTTPAALRVSYTGMLDESEFPRIAEFTGLPLRKAAPFEIEQREETRETGREGSARFNRSGRAQEWREWFTDEQGWKFEELATAAIQKLAKHDCNAR